MCVVSHVQQLHDMHTALLHEMQKLHGNESLHDKQLQILEEKMLAMDSAMQEQQAVLAQEKQKLRVRRKLEIISELDSSLSEILAELDRRLSEVMELCKQRDDDKL